MTNDPDIIYLEGIVAELNASFSYITKAFEQFAIEAGRAAQSILGAFVTLEDIVADMEATLTTGGRIMYWLAQHVGRMPKLEALMWCTEFDGAYQSDLGWNR